MNKSQAIDHAKKMSAHIREMDSQSDDWKCIHALLVIIAQQDTAIEALEFYATSGNLLFMKDFGLLELGQRNVDLQGTNPIGHKARTTLKEIYFNECDYREEQQQEDNELIREGGQFGMGA